MHERRPIGRRIPLHEQELHGELESLALLGQAVEEQLGARELVASVVVVARSRDYAEGRGRARRQAAARGRAQIRVCQPKRCSSHRNTGIGIQRKYQTHSYSYFTYLSIT